MSLSNVSHFFFFQVDLVNTNKQSWGIRIDVFSTFCGQSCPLELLHKPAKKILYILRNRVDFTIRVAKSLDEQIKITSPIILPDF